MTDRLRSNNFDALRLTFASMVVVHHMGILSQAPALAWTAHISAPFAVQAFFVVSGFLVTMSFESSSSLKSYFLKRLRRIAPAYVVVVVGAAMLLCVLSTLSLHDYFRSPALWRYLGFNLMLSNFVAPTLPGVFQSNFATAVNGSLWTIKIEVAFYCLVPIFVWAVRRYGYRRVLPILFTGSVAWKLGFNALGAAGHAKFYAELAKQIPGQLCFFSGGAWAYYLTRDGDGIGPWTSGTIALFSVLVYAIGNGWYMDALQPLAVTGIVYWGAIAGPHLPFFGKYGDFSYGTYLYHFPVIQSAVAMGLFATSPHAAAGAVLAAVAVCAVTSWFCVESPALHRRRNL